jgi:hypothetical protein
MAAIKRIEIMLLFGRLIVGMLLLSTHQPCRTLTTVQHLNLHSA